MEQIIKYLKRLKKKDRLIGVVGGVLLILNSMGIIDNVEGVQRQIEAFSAILIGIGIMSE